MWSILACVCKREMKLVPDGKESSSAFFLPSNCWMRRRSPALSTGLREQGDGPLLGDTGEVSYPSEGNKRPGKENFRSPGKALGGGQMSSQ